MGIARTVLFVGNLVHVKGVDRLLRAWAILADEGRKTKALDQADETDTVGQVVECESAGAHESHLPAVLSPQATRQQRLQRQQCGPAQAGESARREGEYSHEEAQKTQADAEITAGGAGRPGPQSCTVSRASNDHGPIDHGPNDHISKIQNSKLDDLRSEPSRTTSAPQPNTEHSHPSSFSLQPSAFSLHPSSFSLILIGDGPLRKKLEKLARDLGVADSVQFLGRIPHDELPEYMRAAHCLCLPSRSEGMPNVVLEALACGTPAVATAVGEVPFLIQNGVNGFMAVHASHASGQEERDLLAGESEIISALAEGIEAALGREWRPETISATVAEYTWQAAAMKVAEAAGKGN